MARCGSDISRIQRVCSDLVISTQSRGTMLLKGLADHILSKADSKGSLAMAPLGKGSTSSLVETPGLASPGRLAAGTIVMGPMLLLSQSYHILKNGSKDGVGLGIGASASPPFTPESVISCSSSSAQGYSYAFSSYL